MGSKRFISDTRLAALALLSVALLVVAPRVATADTLQDLYGTQYDRALIIEEGLADDCEAESDDAEEPESVSDYDAAELATGEEGIALASNGSSSASVSPRSVSSEMLYFCKWESGQDYDHGLSYGDGYHALGYFQFDNRYDLGTFLEAVYNYDPSKYSALALIGSRYGWNVEGDTHSGGSFTQLGNDLNSVWHACYKADPTEFSQLQNDWAYTQYYDGNAGIRGSLLAMGINIDNRSDSVKSLVWGMANLFGQGGGSSYVKAGYYYGANWFIKNSGVSESMDDVTFVSTLCNYVINNVASRYPSQSKYWQGWQNRYRDEMDHYLSVIKKWVYENGTWYLEVASTGERVKGWALVNSTWYYLDASTGAMQTGWQLIGGTWYYLASSGAMQTGWILLNGTWYYLASSGAMLTGWQYINGSWYWLDKSSGAMADSRMLTDSLWSDFLSSGAWTGYASGWDYRDGAWYWLETGTRASGWRYVGSRWYWLDKTNNKAAANTVLTIDSVSYAFDSDCKMAQNGWCLVEDAWYWGTGSGTLASGWQLINGTWYWFDGSSHAMKTGWLLLGTTWYWLDSSGAMKTGWQYINGSWYWLESSGAMQAGWLLKNGTWYWLDKDSGAMATGWMLVNGTWYWFDSSGAMKTGWQRIGGTWYYFNSDGAMQKSKWIGNYYLLESGAMATSQWIGNYYVDANGCWVPNAKRAS